MVVVCVSQMDGFAWRTPMALTRYRFIRIISPAHMPTAALVANPPPSAVPDREPPTTTAVLNAKRARNVLGKPRGHQGDGEDHRRA